MRLADRHQEVETAGIAVSQVMQISDDPIIWRMLTDQLYTHENAWIREYAQNARDVDPNWKITFPSLLVPEVQFIDNGPSMSRDFMLTRFCQAGFSTKRDDDMQSGGYGIGRLSGPQGTIFECRNEDAIRTYTLIKSTKSIPSLIMLSEEPRPAGVPVGTTVKVPIQVSKISATVADINKFLRFYDLPNLPKVDYILKGDDWGILKTADNYTTHRPLVEVGGYTFPVVWSDIATASSNLPMDVRNKLEAVFRETHQMQLLFRVPIGSVQIALNRESVKFEEDGVKAIWKVVSKMLSAIEKDFQEAIDKEPTLWQAKLRYAELRSSIYHASWYNKDDSIKYKGMKLTVDYRCKVSEFPFEYINLNHKQGRNSSGGISSAFRLTVPGQPTANNSGQLFFTPPSKYTKVTIVVCDTDDAVSRRIRGNFTINDHLLVLYPRTDWSLVTNPNQPRSIIKIDDKPGWHKRTIEWIDPPDTVKVVMLSDLVPMETEYQMKKAAGQLPKRTGSSIRNDFFQMGSSHDVSFDPIQIDLNDPVPKVWIEYHKSKLDPGEPDKNIQGWFRKSIFPSLAIPADDFLTKVRKMVGPITIIGVPRANRDSLPTNWKHLFQYVTERYLSDKTNWQDYSDAMSSTIMSPSIIGLITLTMNKVPASTATLQSFKTRQEKLVEMKTKANPIHDLLVAAGMQKQWPRPKKSIHLGVEFDQLVKQKPVLQLLQKLNPTNLSQEEWDLLASHL